MKGFVDMQGLPLISVIVPVYGVEAYLDQCVQSIVDQTYQNLEIILVDDGSPDNCGAMCDAWAEKDSRIRVIHKPNGGLSDARNAGLAVARGQLIGFVDSDDWIVPNMYADMYARMVHDGSDMACCGLMLFWDSGRPDERLSLPGDMLLDNSLAMRAIVEETYIKHPACNKLYKEEKIHGIHFPVGKCNEDAFWTYQTVAKAASVSILEDPMYRYRQRDNSIMGTTYSLKRLDYLEAHRQLRSLLKKEYPELMEIAKGRMLFSYLYSMEMSMRYLSGQDQETAFHLIRTAVSEVLPVKPTREFSVKENIWLILAQISFAGVCRLQIALEDRKN